MLDLINVALNFGKKDIPVGRLIVRQKKIFFEFEASFLSLNLPISPIQLLPRTGIQTFDPHMFEGLPGVFNDSLPDGWGRLLFDRSMRARGINIMELSALDRLAHVGRYGMGALVYEPDQGEKFSDKHNINLDLIARQAHEVLDNSSVAVLDELFKLNGSSAGARPKILIGVDTAKNSIIPGLLELPKSYEHWLVKFANTLDGADSGAIEYVYAKMARIAGLDVPEHYLFPSNTCAGYFGTKRFDRQTNSRLHVHTACGLLHSDFRTPSLDYEDLIKLTLILTKDQRQVEKMFRLAVFNVCSHNRDDHSKNFSYIMNEQGIWTLSPAYDLTYSSGPNGEQSTTVVGIGKDPKLADLYNLAVAASINKNKARQIIDECHNALLQWKTLAAEVGIETKKIKEIFDSFVLENNKK